MDVAFSMKFAVFYTKAYTSVKSVNPPLSQIDIIGAMVIVWRVRGNIIRPDLCNIVCNNGAQCNAHTYEQT